MALSAVEEIIFSTLNKQYGAYDLRSRYAQHMVWALAISTISFTLTMLLIFKYIHQKEPVKTVDYRTDVFDIKQEKIPGFTLPKPAPGKSSPNTGTKLPKPSAKKEIIKTPVNEEVQKPASRLDNSNSTAQETEISGGKAGDSAVSYVFERLTSASEDTIGQEQYSSEIYFNVDQDASFPGGPDSLVHFIKQRVRITDYARQQKVNGIVYLLVLVEATGKISEYKVYRGIEASCDAAVLEAFSATPDWIPARKKGKKVRQRIIVGIPYIHTYE